MDIVITYVDGSDSQWQADYSEYVGGEVAAKRFRDWGTLKYLLRGIERHIPFARNVYLVVSRRSQVPGWVDRENLKIVLHEDIIPAEFLPVFNSCAIEMFLHNIEGLDEEYVYYNDDMYPVRDCIHETFFRDGRPVIGFSKCLFSGNLFMKQVRLSDNMARKALDRDCSMVFVRPQHIGSPMLRSVCQQVYSVLRKEILESISRLRTPRSINQYLFLDYMYYSGLAIPERISKRHLSLAVNSASKISRFLDAPDADFACINDVQMSDEKFLRMRGEILAAFERKFPEKSSFEK